MELKPIEISSLGQHTDKHGVPALFSEDVLQASVDAYDPGLHEAPLTIGHPKENEPAYGWVKALEYADGVMTAVPHQVEPTFSEMVNSGRFKKRSASFYRPDSPHNPVPGVYYLRHVGFLGAQPPAIKGLKDYQFADHDEGVIELEFSDNVPLFSIASVFRGLREFLLEKFSKDEADQVVPDYLVGDIEGAAQRSVETDATPQPAFTESHQQEETMTPEEIAAKEADIKQREEAIAAREAEFAEREQRIEEADTERRRKEAVDFVETLIEEGKVLPRDQDPLAEFLCGLDDEAEMEFGEGEDKSTQPRRAWFTDFLSRLPNQVDFSERAAPGNESHVDNSDAEDIAKRAAEFQEAEQRAGRTVSISQAVQHVTQGGKQ